MDCRAFLASAAATPLALRPELLCARFLPIETIWKGRDSEFDGVALLDPLSGEPLEGSCRKRPWDAWAKLSVLYSGRVEDKSLDALIVATGVAERRHSFFKPVYFVQIA